MADLRLDLRYLKCALCAAELGSFRRAATALDLPQSTVSRRIQLLEHRLGFPLFSRETHGATLTLAGADFLKDALVGAYQLDRAASLAAAVHRGERGGIRVGIIAALRSGFLHVVLRRFKQSYPEIRITLNEGTPSESLHKLAMGELDISFVTGQPDVPGHVAQLLWNESIYAALPETHELSARETIAWDEIRGETFVVCRGGPGPEIQDCLIRNLSRSGFRPRLEMHDVSVGSLLDLVAMDYGVTLASASFFQTDGEGVVFRPIAGGADSLPRSAVWSETNVNPALRQLISLAKHVSRTTLLRRDATATGTLRSYTDASR